MFLTQTEDSNVKLESDKLNESFNGLNGSFPSKDDVNTTSLVCVSSSRDTDVIVANIDRKKSADSTLTPHGRTIIISSSYMKIAAACLAGVIAISGFLSIPVMTSHVTTAVTAASTTAPVMTQTTPPTAVAVSSATPPIVQTAAASGFWATEPQLPDDIMTIPHADAVQAITQKAAFIRNVLSKSDTALAEGGAVNVRELYEAKLLVLKDIAASIGVSL